MNPKHAVFLPLLKNRYWPNLQALHVLQAGNSFLCLDINETFSDLNLFKATIGGRLRGIKTDETLPAAPLKQWERYSKASNGGRFTEFYTKINEGHWLRVALVKES